MKKRVELKGQESTIKKHADIMRQKDLQAVETSTSEQQVERSLGTFDEHEDTWGLEVTSVLAQPFQNRIQYITKSFGWLKDSLQETLVYYK